MIENTKKKLSKRSLSLIITSSVLALLIALYACSGLIIGALKGNGPSTSDNPDYIPEIGEGVYGNSALAYPSFMQSQVQAVQVESHKGDYDIYRSSNGDCFWFGYYEEDGKFNLYYPKIVGVEGTFDYTSLYATEQGDGLNVHKITYLLATLGTLLIDQRVKLSDSEEERARQLNRYGLGEEDKETIFIEIKDSEGKEVLHQIEIGDKLLAGTGYYYRVDNRDYVYTSTGTYIDYALGGFEGFISPNLVAEGLESDGIYEPYYTTDYSQWKNKVTRYDDKLSPSLQALVAKNSNVVGKMNIKTPILSEEDSYLEANGIDKATSNGYVSTGIKSTELCLDLSSATHVYPEVVSFLTGKRLGDYSADKLLYTLLTDNISIDFGEADAVSYEYEITGIESVLSGGVEYNADKGYAKVSDTPARDTLKISYNYYLNGEKQNEIIRYAAISVSELESYLGAEQKESILNAELGKTMSPVRFTVDYDKETAMRRERTLVISEISVIIDPDADGGAKYVDKVSENSAIRFSYYFIDGDTKSAEETQMTTMADMKERGGNYKKIYDALLGKTMGENLEIKAYTDVFYFGILSSFVSYEIESLDRFIEKELISSFEFVNASNRDSFFGESLHINTLPASHRYSNYALNSTACEKVVRLLGGIGLDTSTSHSAGLKGAETVSLGITPEKMEKYGLYANTVYFELPRGIEKVVNPDPDALDDYTYLSTLGFTLYISDYNYEEGCRYIASDMYDVIARVEGEDFDYLDLSFADFYARRNLVLVDYRSIDKVSVEFSLEDFYGSYGFDLSVQTVWIANGELYLEKPEDISSTEKDFLTVYASANGETTGNKLTDKLSASGADRMTLAELYENVTTGTSYLGSASFQDLLLLMFNTYYLGTLTDSEQQAGLEGKRLMRIEFTVTGSKYDTYRYDFYRVDDRRVMVSLSNPGYDNAVNDFYITTFAFKKIIANYDRLLNGEEIDSELVYD